MYEHNWIHFLHSERTCHRDADDLADSQVVGVNSGIGRHDRLHRCVVLAGDQPQCLTIAYCMSECSERAHVESPFLQYIVCIVKT